LCSKLNELIRVVVPEGNRLKLSRVSYQEEDSEMTIGEYNKRISVYKGPDLILTLDLARVMSSDAAGDCSSNLTVEIPACKFTCGIYCSPVKEAV